MPNLLQVIAAAMFSWPWANPTWVKLTPTPINLTPLKTVLAVNKALTVDDQRATVQIAFGDTTPETSHAFVYGTLDTKPAKAVHVELCRTDNDCVTLRYRGMWDSREHYGANYSEPDKLKRGDKFREVRIWSEIPMQNVIVHWISGDTG